MEIEANSEAGAEAKRKDIDPALAVEMRDAAKPIGDFVAQVASAICVLFCFLDFYVNPGQEADVYKGFETFYGIVILACAITCFVFATFVMFSKFFNKDFWLSRSPGWVYMGTAGVVIVISVMAMAFPCKDTAVYEVEYLPMMGCFFSGLFMAFGGLMKF